MALSCPFCNSKRVDIIEKDKYQYNSYSFILAKYKNCTETELIENSQPLLCSSCSLSFFHNWISDQDNHDLYTKLVPIHPSSENIINRDKHFTSHYLLSRLSMLCKNNISSEIRGRYTREVNSLLTSIGIASIDDSVFLDINNFMNKFKKRLSKKDLDNLLIPGSKYAGFKHRYLEDLVKDYQSFDNSKNPKYSLKNRVSYTEIGSPIWGLLGSENLKNKSLCFAHDLAENFWSLNNEHLEKFKLKYNSNFDQKAWLEIDESIIIAAFACIDHSKDLINFLKKIFLKTNYFIGTFEETLIGFAPPIQHHYNLNYHSLNKALSSFLVDYQLSVDKSLFSKYTFFEIKIR